MMALKGLRGTLALLLTVGISACVDSSVPTEPGPMPLQLSVVGPQAVSAEETAALGDAFDRVDSYVVTVTDAITLEQYALDTIQVTAVNDQHTLSLVVSESAFGRDVTISLIAYDGTMELYRSTTTVTLGDEVGEVPVQLAIRYTGPGIRGAVRDASGDGVGGVTVELQGGSTVETFVTEDDGTYLFLDVPPGSYFVQPVQPSGVNVCPVFRDVTITGDEAILASFRTQTDICGTSVLVVSGGDFDDTGAVASMLATDPNLTVSTFFHVNELPGVDFLDDHDVVLLFMNGLFDESQALGTEVADYVGLGGNVVLASFYWQGHSQSGIGSTGWGSLETIDPFVPLIGSSGVGGATYSAVSLDPLSLTGHALTSGVTTLSSASYSSGVQARSGTTVVASWDDGAPGAPLVGYRTGPAGQRLVGVSLFPAPDPSITGDAQQLWLNAVNWAGAAGGPG